MSECKLEFICDVNLDKMPKTNSGVYCSKCQIDVIDFRGKSNSEIKNLLDANATNKCGRFQAKQLHEPFGDRRDHLVSFYQNAQKVTHPLKRYIAIAASSSLLFLAGCGHRQMAGAYAQSNPSNEHQKLQKFKDSEKSKQDETALTTTKEKN